MSKKDQQTIYGRFETLNYWQRGGLASADVSSSARYVWHILWGHADDRGICSLSFRSIAKESGYSDRWCKKLVAELVEKKIIKVVKSGNFQGEKNTYAIAVKRKKLQST